MTGYPFRGSNSINFHFCLPSHEGQLLKKRICSYRSKFSPLRVDPILGKLHFPGQQTGTCLQELSPNVLRTVLLGLKDGNFPSQNNPRNLDQSYKTDPEF